MTRLAFLLVALTLSAAHAGDSSVLITGRYSVTVEQGKNLRRAKRIAAKEALNAAAMKCVVNDGAVLLKNARGWKVKGKATVIEEDVPAIENYRSYFSRRNRLNQSSVTLTRLKGGESQIHATAQLLCLGSKIETSSVEINANQEEIRTVHVPLVEFELYFYGGVVHTGPPYYIDHYQQRPPVLWAD